MNPQPKPVRELDSSRLDFARKQGCLIQKYHQCEGPVDAHHVIGKGQGKVGSKVSDRRTVGLCRAGHKMAARRDLFEQLFPIVFEEEIARINREFDALPKTTRKERKPAATLKYSLFHCECGLSHRIPPTRADYTAKGAEFVCPRLGKRVQATWRKSA